MPDAPRRLTFIFQRYNPPLYFITFNTHRRKKILATAEIHKTFIEFAAAGVKQGLAIGRYVIMPGHIHLFVRGSDDCLLSQRIRLLKRVLSSEITAPVPHWQKGFFDRLIRHSESYWQKWEYVRQNPVRARLVRDPDEWSWQGEIVSIETRS